MLIENEFDVAASPAEVYALMLDPERVATCINGAEVTGKRDDGSYDAQVTVKLGPVKMNYKGTIAIVESDPAARTASMLAKGSETRGQGTAQATLNMAVSDGEGGGSHVRVAADMLITGRVAQMGRGVMQDVARRMIGQMAQNMEALLTGGAPSPRAAIPSPRRRSSGRWSPIARSASSARRASSGPLAALAGYALLSLALFGRGVLRDGGVVGLVRRGSGELHLVARVVAARDRARAPSAPDEPRLRARRLEPGLDERDPGPALLSWPLTAVAGPVAVYDLLALAAPALAAWCAYLLCRELGTGTPAALAGGLVFGFTTYESAETLNHLNLALVFTLPLAGLLVARYLRGALSGRRFTVLFALCTLGVFATFLETLFWATLGGAFALGARACC